MFFRNATAIDAPLIADMHTQSWRSAYAHIMDAAYLDGQIEQERLDNWKDRLNHPVANQKIIVAEVDQTPLGFICAIGKNDPQWGTLIDNLHALPSSKGKGVGSALLAQAATWSMAHWPDVGMYLYCYADNVAARDFYLYRGGKVVEELFKPAPDGQQLPELRIHWSDPNLLIR